MTRFVRTIAILTGIAQIVFLLSWIVAVVYQPRAYSVAAYSISDMYAVTAPHGEVLVVIFTITGAITVLFAVVVWRALRSAGWTAAVGAMLLGLSIFGLGDLLTPFERLACQLADPSCSPADQLANAGGQLDATLSTIGVAAFVAGLVFLSFAMRKVATWERWARATLAIAILVFVLFVADGVLASSGLAGLVERLLATVGAVWILCLAVAILSERFRGPAPRRN